MSSLSDKNEQVKLLANGKGVQFLLNEAYKILGNPIIMFDTNYSFLSCTDGVITDDPIWNEIVANGGFASETIELFKEEGFIDAMANAKIIALLISDKLKYNRISGKVFSSKNIHIANLVIVACNKRFEAEDPAIFEAVCNKFSHEISTNKSYQEYEEAYEETLIRKLIDGNIDDKELYSAHIAILYTGLKDNIYLVVAGIAESSPLYAKLAYLKNLLMKKYPDFKYSIYDNYIVIIISSNNAIYDIKKDFNKLYKFFEKKNMYVGISSCFDNLFELKKYYAEAAGALIKGWSGNSSQRVFWHNGID